MIRNFFISAFRFLVRNWRHVVLNLFGFSTGLFVFFLASSLQEHELNHDSFFSDSENIYGVFTHILPQSGFGTSRVYGTAPVIAPLIAANFPSIQSSSRYIERQQTVRVGTDSYNESVKYVDPEFTEIFEFDYLSGSNERALESGTGVIITREAAQRFFGRVDVAGEVIQLEGSLDLAVAAVIEDLPSNSHFVYRYGTAERLQVLAPIQSLETLGASELLSSWGAVSDRYRLWLKLAPDASVSQLSFQISQYLQDHIGEAGRDIIDGVGFTHLSEWNYQSLSANGIPLVGVVVVLAGIVLLVAVFNYSNLFTALTVGRLKELAIRKTLGASRYQLSLLMLIESLLLTSVAAVLATLAVSVVLPAAGQLVGKEIEIINLFSWSLLKTILTVIAATAILAIAYPLYVVSRLSIAASLRGQQVRGRVGTRVRTALVVLQFSFNAILGTLMATGLLQNQHLLTADPGFTRDNVVILNGLRNESVNQRLDTLVTSLQSLPGVESVAGSSQHPLQEIHYQGRFSREAELNALDTNLYQFSVAGDFFGLYDIELIQGRGLQGFSDTLEASQANSAINVLVNQSAVEQLNLNTAEQAVGASFYSQNEQNILQAFRIVGVVEDANLLGLANDIKPSMFYWQADAFSSLSVKFRPDVDSNILATMNATWNELFPEIPADSYFLEQYFQQRFGIFVGINRTLIALSLISIVLAISGLYGLILLLIQQRRKEVAVRRVFGASILQLFRFLSLQFTRPVFFGLVLGAPIGVFAAAQYLSLFSERIENVVSVAATVSVLILVLAWLTVSQQILRASRVSPVNDLRSE